MCIGIVILIYKKVDRKQIKNYQPTSLLCVIIAKTMAKKMNNVMHKVVLDDQICFNPSWNINENIITFLEVQDYMHNFQKPRFAFLANIKNLFDSICICRRFLQAFLKKIKLWFIYLFLVPHTKQQINYKVDYKWFFLLWFSHILKLVKVIHGPLRFFSYNWTSHL